MEPKKGIMFETFPIKDEPEAIELAGTKPLIYYITIGRDKYLCLKMQFHICLESTWDLLVKSLVFECCPLVNLKQKAQQLTPFLLSGECVWFLFWNNIDFIYLSCFDHTLMYN